MKLLIIRLRTVDINSILRKNDRLFHTVDYAIFREDQKLY